MAHLGDRGRGRRWTTRHFVAALLCVLLHAGEQRATCAQGAEPVAPTRQTLFKLHQGDNGWQLQAPDGQRFFSLGVCVVDQGTRRENYNAERPSYAAWRHYGSSGEWADATLSRLKTWRFTTVGGWSDFPALRASKEQTLYLTPVLHLGSTVGAPWLDMWDERNLARMERLATERIDPLRDDPRVIGYYSDNEIGWWNADLWRMTFEQPATSGQRLRLVALLREIYKNDWNALTADFVPQGAGSWDELQRQGGLRHRPGGDGIRAMRRFLELMAERYYWLMRDAIQRHDPDALFLGDRYQSFYYPEVARTSGKYVDVTSTNLNASWNDGRFLRSQLDTLHELTGKPLLVSEFYMSAMDNRSGNKNESSGFPVVATQSERVEGTRTTLDALARLPYVLGADWFQYYDEPPFGRGDGEDYNFGLVDIEDAPYDGVTKAFAEFDAERLLPMRTAPRVDATSGVPPAPADPLGQFQFMTALKSWDHERGFVPAASKAPLGDLYVCWTPEALYVAVYALDIVESAYYEDAIVSEADRATWTVRIGEQDAVTIRLGGGQPPITSDPTLEMAASSGVNHKVRLIAAVRIPASRLGREQLQAGDEVLLDSSLETHGRAYRMEWKATLPLAE